LSEEIWDLGRERMLDFKHTNLSWNRTLGDYTKVQLLYSRLVRNKKFQLKTLPSKPYVNIGCGPNIDSKFINIDYQWRPKIDLCWDITIGLPLKSNSVKGVYTEHCLEHIEFSSCQFVIEEIYRILMPGGIARIIVPDAELYLDLYEKKKKGENVSFPYERNSSDYTPMMAINRVFRDHEHKFAYDYETLKMMLHKAGFAETKKEIYKKGKDVELLVDSEERKIESLYVEAIKLTL
jgi:predicted SAM-dependent methyltransferase